MDSAKLDSAKAAYEAAYAESLRQYEQDSDHAAFAARNMAASKQYKTVEQEVHAAADATLTAQARQDHRYDEFFND